MPSVSTNSADETTEAAIYAGRLTKSMSFNQKIWAICSRIPAGKVATYADLAAAIGSTGYRAVGNAMNKNPYAPRVPCHRVVGSDGKLTGYAGGLAKKKAMLIEEGIEIINERVDLRFRCKLNSIDK
ncbi:MAG TPA: MGMT family protein [Tepidisphaeraceae bacterium]|nr:MGMT family protein [Tepidisphaeraceae bacterium]